VFDDNDSNDLYYNDMRLMLAAAYQASGSHLRAAELMQKFTQVQIAKGEPQWTNAARPCRNLRRTSLCIGLRRKKPGYHRS
jgi:hypothetical protein